MYLFLAFLLVPIVEIALFIQVGGLIGLWPTLLIVVMTAVLGTYLVRAQGLMALGQVQRSFNELQDPTAPLAHGAMILVSGALLLTPGFFTDAVGFALLVPKLREMLFLWLKSRITVSNVHVAGGFTQHRNAQDEDIIDGEWKEVTPRHRSGPSGWVEDRKK